MRQNLSRFLAPAIALVAMGFTQDAVKVARTYKADETSSIKFEISAVSDGQNFKASGEVILKVSKLLDGGLAKATFSPKDLKATMEGSDLPTDASPFETTVDGFGLPDSLPTESAEMVYSLAAFTQIAPQKSLKPGESFDIDWTNNAKTAKVKGKGKLIEIGEADGIKAAKFEFEFEATPDTNKETIHVKTTSWLELANGRMVKCEGKMAMGDKVTISLKAARGK